MRQNYWFIEINRYPAHYQRGHDGDGEPLLNLNNVVPAMDIMMDDFGFGLSKRRVTLSTSGVVPALDKLGDMIDVALAISLHAPTDDIRDEIVPINRKYNIETFLAAVRRYLDKSKPTAGGLPLSTLCWIISMTALSKPIS